MPRILHLLSQRPSLTGSGITLTALVRHAAEAGWNQRVVVGIPADDPSPAVGGLTSNHIETLKFETTQLPFPIPGMSDVMPYRSTRWSDMSGDDIEQYRSAWASRLTSVLEGFRPDVIHVHHLWILGAMIKDLAPDTPVVSHCHATGLRQMTLCPHLAESVRAGCRRNETFVVLHPGHSKQIQKDLGIPESRIHVVGAGYRQDLFNPSGRAEHPNPRLLYVGKFANAKGLPWLLDAFEMLRADEPDLELHIAGAGSGSEAEQLHERMKCMAPGVVLHGQLNQTELADLMRRTTICVLPSFYEGVPLVLVEALACGCRLVSTALPGVLDVIAGHIPSDVIEIVPLPRLEGPDTPFADDLPVFTTNLVAAIKKSIDAGRPKEVSLQTFTWKAVFDRVEPLWKEALNSTGKIQ